MDSKCIFSNLFNKRNDELNYPILKKSFGSVEILDSYPKSELKIDGIESWSFEDNLDGSLVSIRKENDEFQEIVPFSKNESFRKVVQSYLNQPGINIESLTILNHPYGLEGGAPLKVRNLKWKLEINSSRYDYTTWFSCLRNQKIENVEIELNGDDYTVLSEDVISSATKLHIKTKNPLPIQAILNFKASELRIEQELSSHDLLTLCGSWIQNSHRGRIVFKRSDESLEFIG